jgi:hypothetical protein
MAGWETLVWTTLEGRGQQNCQRLKGVEKVSYLEGRREAPVDDVHGHAFAYYERVDGLCDLLDFVAGEEKETSPVLAYFRRSDSFHGLQRC